MGYLKLLKKNADIDAHSYLNQKVMAIMKKLICITFMGIGTFVFGSEPLTVQVISAVHEKSVTKAFDAKVKKTGMEVHKKVENNRFVVTVGEFDDHQSAKKGETIARQFVTKDAFIRPVDRHASVSSHKASAHEPAKAHSTDTHAVAPTKHEPAHAEVAHSATEAKPAVEAVVAVKPIETKPVVASVAEVKTPDVKAASIGTVSDCDRRDKHRDEIAEAINYYKNSPYHRFEPVRLR